MTIDFSAEAELYLGSDRNTARNQGPRTFSSAAKAIRFALEEAAPVSLRGALLIVQGRTYAAHAVRTLYRQHEYPLNRKSECEAESLARQAGLFS